MGISKESFHTVIKNALHIFCSLIITSFSGAWQGTSFKLLNQIFDQWRCLSISFTISHKKWKKRNFGDIKHLRFQSSQRDIFRKLKSYLFPLMFFWGVGSVGCSCFSPRSKNRKTEKVSKISPGPTMLVFWLNYERKLRRGDIRRWPFQKREQTGLYVPCGHCNNSRILNIAFWTSLSST